MTAAIEIPATVAGQASRPRGVVIASPGGTTGGGGMGSVTRTIADGLGLCDPPIPCTVIDPRGDGAIWRSPGFFMGAVLRLIAARRSGADILHLQVSERTSFLRKGLLLFLGRTLGMRTVLHHHGAELVSFYEGARPLVRWWTRLVSRRADRTVVLGEAWRRFAVRDAGVAPRRVVLLRNGAGDVAPAVARRRQGAGTDRDAGRRPVRLAMIANLSDRKGVPELLAALVRLRQNGHALRATFAGGGEIERFRREAERLGVGDICVFTGWVGREAVLDVLSEADISVLPSHDEGLPMAIIEAMSAGLAVVATPVGAIPEVLTHERDCLLVPPGSVDALTAALERLIADPALRRALAAEGRAQFERRFSAAGFMENLLVVYADALRPEPG